ncbi:NAD(P)H-binding protein [Amycolatopsis anabasis]|uniref:NAD(P)H-binding protein n=1 Tax=Amycolatopsis anabasis TaxID=1840409 RepID=UPI00131DF1EA|nr:NAD(P)H-binding protein [Amycolatopsis anabasis]
MTKSILVLGATGKTGRRVVSLLRDAGHPVLAASRSADVRFDWADESTWDIEGADSLYLVPPEDDLTPVQRFVPRIVARGVRRIVLLSGRGIEAFGESQLIAERAVRESTVDWTILRPAWFDQNFDEGFFRDPLLAGQLALPVGQGREPFIDARDIADVAVAALTGSRHAGQIYELTGPRSLTFAEAVGILAKSSGRDLRFTEVTLEEFDAAQVGAGFHPALVKHLGELFDTIRRGEDEPVEDGVPRALGRPARSFEDYAATVDFG